jgi:hypothetical protein
LIAARTSFTKIAARTSFTRHSEALRFMNDALNVRGLSESIFVFFNLDMIQEKLQFLIFDIDSSHNVFMLRFQRGSEKFSEDIQLTIAPNETHEMIGSFLRFLQWMPRRFFPVRKNQFPSAFAP